MVSAYKSYMAIAQKLVLLITLIIKENRITNDYPLPIESLSLANAPTLPIRDSAGRQLLCTWLFCQLYSGVFTMTTYTLKYGTLEITGIMYSRTQRTDKYTNKAGDIFYENCHVTDFSDDSAHVAMYDRESPHYRQYNPACSCCFLNFTHSTNLHDRNISQ